MSRKTALYRACKALGLFSLARRLTRRKLRILCYHGTELRDESQFASDLFIRAGTFAKRLALIRQQGYPVLPLGEAVRRLRAGSLPPCATVITIDDGFHSTFAAALPLLRAAGMPATVYVTSYYVEHDAPVFRLAMQYCFFRTLAGQLDLGRLECGAGGAASLRSPAQKKEVMWELINHGEMNLDEQGRAALLAATARELRVDLGPTRGDRTLQLMSRDEVREAGRALDIQLHTHRHRFPDDPMRARAEVEDNRRALQPLVRGPLVHFCYPSGYFSPEFFPWLSAAGIETATTCETGLNDGQTNPYALSRFLDSERIAPIEFEAELCGFAELLRSLRARLRGRKPTVQVDEAERRRGYPAGSGRTILQRGAPAPARESA